MSLSVAICQDWSDQAAAPFVIGKKKKVLSYIIEYPYKWDPLHSRELDP